VVRVLVLVLGRVRVLVLVLGRVMVARRTELGLVLVLVLVRATLVVPRHSIYASVPLTHPPYGSTRQNGVHNPVQQPIVQQHRLS
jgi:hypothetical protein